MKKNTFALLSMLAAMGQAWSQTSSVNVSGMLYSGVGFNSGGVSSSTALGGASSIMFSGKEDLGGGSAALFKMESGFSLDTGSFSSTAFFDKQAFLGMQGPWGTLRMGRIYTPAFATLALVADPTATYSVLQATNLMELHGIRGNNGVIYNTPGFNPWTYSRKGAYGALAHFFGENAQKASRGSATGLNVGYADGPLVIELSHHRSNAYVNEGRDLDSRTTLLGGNYRLGRTQWFFAYSDSWEKNVATNVRTKNANDYLVGVIFPLGKGSVTASYIKKNDHTPANNSAYQLGAVYDHPLSLRTKLSVGFAKINNSNAAKPYRVLNGYAGTTVATAGTSAVTVGMTHRF